MTECPWCQAENADGRAYCVRCGRGFSATVTSEREAAEAPYEPGPLVAWLRTPSRSVWAFAWFCWGLTLVTPVGFFFAGQWTSDYDKRHDLYQGATFALAMLGLFFIASSAAIVAFFTLLGTRGFTPVPQYAAGALVTLTLFVLGIRFPGLGIVAFFIFLFAVALMSLFGGSVAREARATSLRIGAGAVVAGPVMFIAGAPIWLFVMGWAPWELVRKRPGREASVSSDRPGGGAGMEPA